MWIVQRQLKTNKKQAWEFDSIVSTFQYSWKSSAGKEQLLSLSQLGLSVEQVLVPGCGMVDWTRIFWSYYSPSGCFFWRCDLRADKDLLENPSYSDTVVYETWKLKGNFFLVIWGWEHCLRAVILLFSHSVSCYSAEVLLATKVA